MTFSLDAAAAATLGLPVLIAATGAQAAAASTTTSFDTKDAALATPSPHTLSTAALSTTTSSPKARAHSSRLTHEQKRLLCIYAKQHPHVTQMQLAQWARERFGLHTSPSQSSISHTLKRKHNFERMQRDELACKRTQRVKFPALDAALVNWYLDCQAHHVKVQGDDIKAQAQQFFDLLGLETPAPQFSNGWLHSFQIRHGFIARSTSNKIELPLIATRSDLTAALAGVAPCDVYWMHETRLFYSLSPDSNAPSPPPFNASMTLALCVNADGSDSLDPFLVCAAAPSATNSNAPRFSFACAHNRRVWFSPTIFREWLLALDWRMHEANRQIVLLVFNPHALYYCKNVALKSVCVRFVAPASSIEGSSSLFVDVARDVVVAFKRRYRYEFVQYALDQRDVQSRDIYDVSLPQAIEWVIQSWRNVPQLLVQLSFARTGVAIDSAAAADVEAVTQCEAQLDAQLVALLQRLKAPTLLPLDAFVAPAIEQIDNRQRTAQDFVDSVIDASVRVLVVGIDSDNDAMAPRCVVSSRFTAANQNELQQQQQQQQQQQLVDSGSADADSASTTLAAAAPVSDLMSTGVGAKSVAPQMSLSSATAAAVEDTSSASCCSIAAPAAVASSLASDARALQRVLHLATTMQCAPSTLQDLHRMLQTVTHAQAGATVSSGPLPNSNSASPTASVCRFTFVATSSSKKHSV